MDLTVRIRNRHKPRTKRHAWTMRRLREYLETRFKKTVKLDPSVSNYGRGKTTPELFPLSIEEKDGVLVVKIRQ